VLGLLSYATELSGYELKKWCDWSLRLFYWSPSFSQVYAVLRRTEQLGLVSSRAVTQTDAPDKRLYRVTDAGREALRAWQQDAPVDVPVLKHGVMLRVFLGPHTEPERLREIVTAHIVELERRHAWAKVDAEGTVDEPAWAFPGIVLRWSERHYAMEIELARQLLDELDELTARPRRRSRRATAQRPPGAPTHT
jgi:DNA-binding PadR family transcriptional regulator